MSKDFRPYFETVSISKPTIIGEVIDFRPFYNLLNSSIFTFMVGEHNLKQIPPNFLVEFINKSHYVYIVIEARVKFKDTRLAIKYIINEPRGDSIETKFYLTSLLSNMINQLKYEAYNLSSFKDELDTISKRMVDNIELLDGNPADNEMLNQYLKRYDELMKKEIEENFMAADGGAAFLGNQSTIGDSLRDFVEDTLDEAEDMALDMNDTTELLHKIKDTIKPTQEELAQIEEDEYNKIDSYIQDGTSTLRLNRKTIKKLSKDKSDKFILPLTSGKADDIEKFMHLTKQPFSFLNYNGAMFAVDMETGMDSMWDEEKDESSWSDLIRQTQNGLDSITSYIDTKRAKNYERAAKLDNAFGMLSDQIDYLKAEFEKKTTKFGNSAYVKFIATRTANNISTVREAEELARRQLEVLRNKRYIKNPIAFFDRAVTLYLGLTGEDIIHDLYELGYTSREDHELATKYLFFMLRVVKENSTNTNLTAPILTIVDGTEFNIGFEKVEILKVIASHMFVHTITIKKEYSYEPPKEDSVPKEEVSVSFDNVPTSPAPRYVSEFTTDSTGPR